jgi:hypothetical protein
MKRSVYIETTIPSYYYETRQEMKISVWRELTREWWNKYRFRYFTVCSDTVMVELEQGRHPQQKEKILLLKDIEKLPYSAVLDDIVEEYIGHKLMPKEFVGDGYHLAYASYYGIDFLLTWNCVHLANPNKFQHMRIINSRMDLKTPIICTPEQLLI